MKKIQKILNHDMEVENTRNYIELNKIRNKLASQMRRLRKNKLLLLVLSPLLAIAGALYALMVGLTKTYGGITKQVVVLEDVADRLRSDLF